MTKRKYQATSWLRTGLKRSPKAVVRLHKRKKELEAWILHRYGQTTPEDDDAGHEDLLWLMIYSARTFPDPMAAALNVAKFRAPWMSDEERQRMAREAVWSRANPTAKTLANILGVTLKERTELRFTTIGACDYSDEERKDIMRKLRAEVKRERRRNKGMTERTKYLNGSLSRSAPWEAEGVHRRTWERRRRAREAPLVQKKGTDLRQPSDAVPQVCPDQYDIYTEGTHLRHAPDAPCALRPHGARARNGGCDVTHAIAEAKLSSAQRFAASCVAHTTRDQLPTRLSELEQCLERFDRVEIEIELIKRKLEAVKQEPIYYASTTISVASQALH
jgi:hypothetical protein